MLVNVLKIDFIVAAIYSSRMEIDIVNGSERETKKNCILRRSNKNKNNGDLVLATQHRAPQYK